MGQWSRADAILQVFAGCEGRIEPCALCVVTKRSEWTFAQQRQRLRHLGERKGSRVLARVLLEWGIHIDDEWLSI